MMDDKQRSTSANTNANETIESTRRDRDKERDRAPSRTQSSGLPLNNFATRTLEHSLSRDNRRPETPTAPSEQRSSSSLASRIATTSLPPRPEPVHSRENSDRLDRDASRKRTASGLYNL